MAKTLSRLYFPAIKLRTLNCCTKMTAKISWAESTLLAAEAARSSGPDDTRHDPVPELPFLGAVREFLGLLLSRMRSPSVPAIAAAVPERDWSSINPDCGDPKRYCLGDGPSKSAKGELTC